MEHGSLRNLDQIQEGDARRGGSRVGALVLASIAGACLVFAVFALVKRPQFGNEPQVDPLAELAGKSSQGQGVPALDGNQMNFPTMLSDDPNPTTAMIALRAASSSSAQPPFVLPPGMPTVPPTAGDSLPVVPLPAQAYVSPSPIVAEPRDSLTAMAASAANPRGEAVAKGQPGGYQLQVSSYRTEKEAEAFASRLRRGGHHAYVESALVPGKGTWYRVRIGPFKSRWDAIRYRKEFEQREHIVGFLVEPPKKTAVRGD
ncbi:MAG TPA: SPOR domain-containing protein [Polyangiaceae bacterium]|jgi:cell division septation protein DedD|nr:MAG: rare lipoprotein A [Deltaproteobacteria bacterium ADurb.Bin207]HNS96615.1 SPOR domain-containing protein [Polyangiaceae bacterium]HNZ21047.1 SPOR domain-containing protein [Polyangiaceae bacterium]HOD22329.1 SPOR domain-containing protein [Polyangiaceae bacterium]HOE51295.1 SPOR domain-containing protein [Polyangiaceae bacterium]